MATACEKVVGCNLVFDGTLTLKTELNDRGIEELDVRGIVASGDMLMIADFKQYKVHLYRRSDAKLLARSAELESEPIGICHINDTEICVALKNGTILTMSVLYGKEIAVIERGRKLNVITAFGEFHGVVKFNDSVVVYGLKQKKICWCILSVNDGRVGKVYKATTGDRSFLTTKNNMIYCSCYGGILSPQVTGVYGYDIQNDSKQTCAYRHKDLDCPTGITVDPYGFLFVCNWSFITAYIHRLTDKCELVAIYREGIPPDPRDIVYYDKLIYVSEYGSNVINRYKLECFHQQDPAISVKSKSKKDREDEREKPNVDSIDEIYSRTLTISGEYQGSVQRRGLPLGKKYHAFFSYSSYDIEWVKKTVEILEKDHGFLCCEYDRDNTPGTQLLKFADDSIRNSSKTVVVMTKEAMQSGFVQHEIQMALNMSFNEDRKCVVPVLLEDCDVPGYLSVLNYVDARDNKRRDIWWPKLLNELEA